MLLLENIRLIDPSTRTDDIRDILIAERKIIKHGTQLWLDALLIAQAKGEKLNRMDCTGLVAAPGLVDTHVHFRDPGQTWKEDIKSGSSAAIAGGYTSVVCMANTNPVVDNAETLLEILKKGRGTPVHVFCCASLTKNMDGRELVDMKGLSEYGAIGFTDDGRPVLNEALLKQAMMEARTLKMPISLHEEDPRYIKENGINSASPAAEELGLTGADRQAEISLVGRDLKLARETGATIVIQHVSAKESVDMIRRAKKNGVRVHCEATPHHFSLTEDAVLKFGTLAKMNPPLRSEDDRLAILEGLKDGTIDLISTDHAPHTQEEKEKEFIQAPSGIIGLETALSLGIMNLVDTGILSMGELIARMSTNPARLYGLDAGSLKEDSPADVVVFDPEKEWVYNSTKSKSKNSPWFNTKLKGKIILTLCAGVTEYDTTDAE